MSESTDGQICLGVKFKEDFIFPWDDLDDCCIEDWWINTVCKYKPSKEICDKNGEYIDGIKPSDEEISLYYDERREFINNHPLFFDEVNYCSLAYPMVIIALKKSIITANRGDPVELNIDCFKIKDSDKDNLISFCKEYLMGNDENEDPEEIIPKIYLSSYWG